MIDWMISEPFAWMGEDQVQFSKEQVVSMIESRSGSDQAQQAAQQLPDQVDHEDHADLLNKFGINPQEMVSQLGGGGGTQPNS